MIVMIMNLQSITIYIVYREFTQYLIQISVMLFSNISVNTQCRKRFFCSSNLHKEMMTLIIKRVTNEKRKRHL